MPILSFILNFKVKGKEKLANTKCTVIYRYLKKHKQLTRYSYFKQNVKDSETPLKRDVTREL